MLSSGMAWAAALCCALASFDSVGNASAELVSRAGNSSAPSGAKSDDAGVMAPEVTGLNSRYLAALGELPLAFAQRCADGAGRSEFHARGAGYHVQVGQHEAYIAFLRSRHGTHSRASPRSSVNAVRIRLVEAERDGKADATDPVPGTFNSFRASTAEYERCTDVAHYGRVRFPNVYTGIDVVYYGTGSELEFDFIVRAGADPGSIRLAVDNASRVWLDQQGDLVVESGDDTVVLRRPIAYQEAAGRREPVSTQFMLHDGHEVSLLVAPYDIGRALTIDPVLSYATYLGGTQQDYGTAIAVDASGNVYIAGYTTSIDFPLLSPYDKTLASGDVDAFVTKLNASGKGLVYSTYIGGTGIDRAIGIAVDATGNAYVTGTTTGGFPVTPGAYQSTSTGSDSFVAKIGPAGNTLVYSTYVQGVEARSIAVDAAGNAYITGRVISIFGTTGGAYQQTPGGVFVLKLHAEGKWPVYATYLGHGGIESANSIAIDSAGNAYVAGSTDSTTFPSVNALQGAKAGGKDGFVAKLNPAGNALVYSTYLGGALDDVINAIAVDGDGNVYVAGETYSVDFPAVNAFMPNKPGFRLANASLGSAFFAKINSFGNDLVYSSFLGGEICAGACNITVPPAQYPGDAAYGIAVDAQGHAYITGLARSYTFPLVNSTKPAKTQDNQDSAFVVKVSRSGGALLYSNFLRTGVTESGVTSTRFPLGSATGVAADASGAAYVTGDTDTAGAFTTVNAYQTGNGGGQGAIAVKIAGASGSVTLTSSAFTLVAPNTVTLTATVSGVPSGNVLFTEGPVTIGSAAIGGSKAVLTTTLAAGIHRLSALIAANGKEMDSPLVNVVVDNAMTCK